MAELSGEVLSEWIDARIAAGAAGTVPESHAEASDYPTWEQVLITLGKVRDAGLIVHPDDAGAVRELLAKPQETDCAFCSEPEGNRRMTHVDGEWLHLRCWELREQRKIAERKAQHEAQREMDYSRSPWRPRDLYRLINGEGYLVGVPVPSREQISKRLRPGDRIQRQHTQSTWRFEDNE